MKRKIDMQFTCTEFQKYLETLYLQKHEFDSLLKLFEETGDDHALDGVEYYKDKLIQQSKDLRFELTHCSEEDAKEILGEAFAGTTIASEVFDGKINKSKLIPFSRAELIDAKLKGDALVYCPSQMKKGASLNIGGMPGRQSIIPHPHFSENEFDFNNIIDEITNKPILLNDGTRLDARSSIPTEGWRLVHVSGKDEKLNYRELKNTLEPEESVALYPEILYMALACKAISKKMREKDIDYFLTPYRTAGGTVSRVTIQTAVLPSGLTFSPIVLPDPSPFRYITYKERYEEPADKTE